MPNFGNVGKELAKEINEPALEESDDESAWSFRYLRNCVAQYLLERDRLLLDCETSVVCLQAQARGFLTRAVVATLRNHSCLAERHITKLQAHLRALLVRKRLHVLRKVYAKLAPSAIAMQARAHGVLARRRWLTRLQTMRKSTGHVICIQARIRGLLQRRRFQRLKAALRTSQTPVKKLQAIARGHILRCHRKEITKLFIAPKVSFAVVALQAHIRGVLGRKNVRNWLSMLRGVEGSVVKLQAHCRGLIMRRRLRAQLAKLRNVTDIIVSLQAAVRTYLTRKGLLALIRGLRRTSTVVVGFQAVLRGKLVRQHHRNLQKALSQVSTIQLQAVARATIVRTQHRELDKKLEVVLPDVIGLQTTARGALVRADFFAWRHHLHCNHETATILQAMLRGAMQRRIFRQRMDYYQSNLTKIVKIQSLFRAKETREQYRQLTLGTNVSVGTIKNFVHLLDDSEADFQEEIKIERLRKRVVEAIRENQALENDINDLDKTIGLVVHNLKTVEDVLKARKKYGGDNSALNAERASLLAAHGDIFSAANTLDQEARRKLELYQQLFYVLQTKSRYLTGLLSRLSSDDALETSRRFMERAILTLFGYGQDRREDFLLLKLFQVRPVSSNGCQLN